ncbi:Reverse transcriptase domain [Trinorchestia longiramus]|nr:Reverse transcriptase domain [Trinorchestia longiramus]
MLPTPSSRPIPVGVPQGSVISPALFNIFVSDYPPTVPLISSYADDFTALSTTIKIPDASTTLSAHSSDVTTWAQQKGLTVSIAKSQSSLFTSDTHQSRTNLHVTWKGTDRTHCRSPKSWELPLTPTSPLTLT